MPIEVKGINAVVNRWSRANKGIGRKVAGALGAGGRFLLKESKKIVPTETGDLAKSGYVKNIGKRSGFDAEIIVGYTASHAGIVHEVMDAAHGKDFNAKHAAYIAWIQANGTATQKRVWKPRRAEEQAKFLEIPAKTKRRQILKIIARKAKI
jgi:hypothetical protein